MCKIATFLIVVFLLSGCNKTNGPLDQAFILRESILQSNGCSFVSTITADYGEQIYVFSMSCVIDREGNLSFSVIKPDSISGITGNISASGGDLTFDDKVLAFQTIADGQITPVTAPWVFMNTLRSGYINGSTSQKDGYEIFIDDSYRDDALRLIISVKNDVPVSGEIYWSGRRVMSVTVENFAYL